MLIISSIEFKDISFISDENSYSNDPNKNANEVLVYRQDAVVTNKVIMHFMYFSSVVKSPRFVLVRY